MNSFILTVTSRWIVPVMLVFSLFLLFRGHNLPGGGFIGGLTAGVALLLKAFAEGIDTARKDFKINALNWISIGLLLAMGSGLAGLAFGNGIFKGYWLPWEIPVLPKIGTPLLFDVGVYIVVLGSTVLISFRLIQE